MKRSIIIFILVGLSFFIGYSFDDIKAAKVSSNGDFTIRGEKYNINTSPVREGSSWKISELQMYKDKRVSEICVYKEENYSDDKAYERYLFIYSDGSASIGWPSNFNKYGTEEHQEGNTSIIRNWNNGVTASKWDANNSKLTKEYDAYSAYKSSGECPYYIVDNEHWGSNYFYISTEKGFDNLDKLQKIAENNYVLDGNNNVVKESGKLYTFHLQDDLNDDSRKNLKCDYKYEDEKVFSLKFDSNGNPTIENGTIFTVDLYTISAYRTTSEFNSVKYWSYVESKKCPYKIQACIRTEPLMGNSGSITSAYLYGDESAVADAPDCGTKVEFYCISDDKCSSGECGRYSDFWGYLTEKIDNYKTCKKDNNCSKNSLKEYLNEYNDSKDTIVGFCDSVLKNLNYSKGGCVDACLNLSKDIIGLEIEAELRSGYSETKCNIGESVINLVYNVLKWAKYIVPALVVILSILDFIKAIASQSEDDMKKAQGKFVKRLIVAAILFLLPLIINFMLKTFGLYNSTCDITDLFG